MGDVRAALGTSNVNIDGAVDLPAAEDGRLARLERADAQIQP
jgi:hypothetical protein